MAFDQTTRNRLARFVSDARALLTEEFTRQLQNEYGLDPTSGDVTLIDRLTALDDRRRETAKILRETLEYYLAGNSKVDGKANRDMLDRIVREQAFTVLNRLCALRMSEARGLVLESIAKGYQSKGFQLYARLAGSALGETGEAYRIYLFSLMDEFAVDLTVLFDRFSPQGRLFPREAALLKLLELINDPEIEPLWAEDETIGWIYQYFNSREERKAMRDASQAPRNSRELAVRNQFFTPRYVVEFLTDNTLGRIWYEMTRGETALMDICRYLVRRPREIFLGNPHTTYEQDTPWIKTILENADFSALPEQPSIEEIGQFALLIDGYEMAPKFGYGDGLDFANRCLEAQEKGEPLPYDSLELWLILFAYQRGAIRHGFYTSEAEDPVQQNIRRVYEVLRNTLQNPPEDLSQEDLLRQPVYIPHRPLKDPREIKMLDPACGSMHFGLYAFDLFEQIYAESWELEERLGEDALKRLADLDSLHKTYPDKEAYLKDVPRLIIERNVHGVDIDPRAVQIAGLSLWLRAQKSWQAQGLKPHERPQIRKSNVVCAEPMPGDRQMLDEFLSTLRGDGLEALMRKAWHVPADQKVRATPQMADALAKLVRTVWQEMELAGEAGSLLEIEEILRDAIATARTESEKKSPLFRVLEYGLNETAKEQYVRVVAGEEQDFFERIEDLVLAALRDYAEQAENGMGYRRRLFAEDTSQGFSFINLCKKKFDSILMNPPFGEAPNFLTQQLNEKFPSWNKNILCAFIENSIHYLSNFGLVGSVFDKTAAIKTTYETFRRNVLLEQQRLQTQINLGWGVLDDANVEVAALILSKGKSKSPELFFDLSEYSLENKSEILIKAIQETRNSKYADCIYSCKPSNLKNLPNAVIAFEFPLWFQTLFSKSPSLSACGFNAFVGHSFKSNRHFRLLWEIDLNEKVEFNTSRWTWVYNGGEYSPFYNVERDIVFYGINGDAIKQDESITLRNLSLHGKPGIGYGKRGDFIDSQVLSMGHVFTVEGEGVPLDDESDRYYFSALLTSHIFSYGINLYCGQHKYPGYVNLFPCPTPSLEEKGEIVKRAKRIWDIKRDWRTGDETDSVFLYPHLLGAKGDLHERLRTLQQNEEILNQEINSLMVDIDHEFEKIFLLNERAITQVRNVASRRPVDKVWNENNGDLLNKWKFYVSDVLQYSLGCLFGRWDIHYAINRINAIIDSYPKPKRFAAGALTSDTGDNYPIKIFEDGILIADESNPNDITRNINIVLAKIFKENCESFEQDFCELLQVANLSEYINGTQGLFDHHLKRYSKSHRIAPVYWPLSTVSGSYSIWVYYHRINDQTLFTCVNNFVDPKINQIREDLSRLRKKSRSEGEEKELTRLSDLERELSVFRGDLLEVAKFWKPNLNDGVEITAAPLWKLFQHKPWQKRLKEIWQKLEDGEYDWAHLAYSIWPERVREKCKSDKSLAIAHDLEELYVEPPASAKKKKAKKPADDEETEGWFNDD